MTEYDVIIWIDEDGDIVCRGITRRGEEFLQTLYEPYKMFDILEILSHPEEFQAMVPSDVRVGTVHPESKKVFPFSPQALQ